DLDGDEPETRTTLRPIVGGRGPFAVAVLAHGEDVPARIAFEVVHGHDLVVFTQGHAPHATRVSPHGTHLVLVETNRHAVRTAEQQMLFAVGEADTDETIVFVDTD